MKHGQRFLFVCWAVMLGTEIANAITITGQARQLTDNSATQTDPQISGNLVVWTDFRNGNDDVYFGDLASNAETRVTTLTTSQRLQAVSGTRIVYTDFTAPGPHVMLYDVTTGLTSVVGTATASNSRTWARSAPRPHSRTAYATSPGAPATCCMTRRRSPCRSTTCGSPWKWRSFTSWR